MTWLEVAVIAALGWFLFGRRAARLIFGFPCRCRGGRLRYVQTFADHIFWRCRACGAIRQSQSRRWVLTDD